MSCSVTRLADGRKAFQRKSPVLRIDAQGDVADSVSKLSQRSAESLSELNRRATQTQHVCAVALSLGTLVGKIRGDQDETIREDFGAVPTIRSAGRDGCREALELIEKVLMDTRPLVIHLAKTVNTMSSQLHSAQAKLTDALISVEEEDTVIPALTLDIPLLMSNFESALANESPD